MSKHHEVVERMRRHTEARKRAAEEAARLARLRGEEEPADGQQETGG